MVGMPQEAVIIPERVREMQMSLRRHVDFLADAVVGVIHDVVGVEAM